MVILVALIGGLWPALGAAVVGSLLLNYYFTPPLYTFTISDKNNALALLVFIAVAALVSALVERVVRRTTEAGRASAEASILAGLAGGILRGETSLPELLGRARETFGLRSVTLLERDETGGAWTAVAEVGDPDDGSPTELALGEQLRLRVTGPVRASDQRLLAAFAAQAAAVHEREELADRASQAAVVAEADRTRAALLHAVSHDLRSPLASAKASVTSLRSDRIQWPDEARRELLLTADESLDRLTAADREPARHEPARGRRARRPPGAGGPRRARAAGARRPRARRRRRARRRPRDPARGVCRRRAPRARPGQPAGQRAALQPGRRAARWWPPASTGAGSSSASSTAGPASPRSSGEQMFAPFQRLGDRDTSTGVGLGLALSLRPHRRHGRDARPPRTRPAAGSR